MTTFLERFRGFYGAHPLQAMILLGCFALTGYVAVHISADPTLLEMVLWFAGAVIAHDLVLFPLYTLADRVTARTLHPRAQSAPPRLRALNHLRIPTLASGLLLLLFFPGIIQQGHDTYLAATGQDQHPYLGRWLLLTAAFFTISALLYTIRLAQTARQPHSQ